MALLLTFHRAGNIKTTDALLLSSPAEISKKAKLSLNEAQLIIRCVSKELSPPNLGLSVLRELERRQSRFTTGDMVLDKTIGGGVRTGMVWELVGEG